MSTVAVIGASGRTGRQAVDAALASGRDVIAVVRTPRRDFPTGVVERQADVEDPASLRGALDGAYAVVSALGPDDGRLASTVCSRGTANIVSEMQRAGIDRLVVISAVPVSADDEKPWFERRVLHPILWRFFGPSYRDLRVMEGELAGCATPNVVVRPPLLTDDTRRRPIRTSWDAPMRRPRRISRAALGRELVAAATAEPFRSGVLTVSE